MDEFLALVLKKIDGDPSRLGEVFSDNLSHQEELMLSKLDEEIGICVERVLDFALTNANAANNGEISIDQNQRDRVMLLTAVRKEIHNLLAQRGTLNQFRDRLN
ncbi:MAG: hypothetical protein IPN95_01130 [Bacteroidetes bacterium]|jgi:hypothetical protein|nr:hypothetical protein [Bacteroidota bacterium]MBL0015234.1 hypothetical protein [Bacteroidota bacterium]MBP6638966.1 hypothetical protein [Bacteroidia bacterium]MBP8073184.1 hypothetical protein [Bacteroidia bacterium]